MSAPLRQATFRRIWLASLLSNLGMFIQGVGAAWAMTQMTSSAELIALVQTALMLPIMLTSLAAGAIADMYDRRIVGLAALSVALAGATALSILAHLNLVNSDYPSCFLLYYWDRNGLVWPRLAGLRQRASTFASAAGCHCAQHDQLQHRSELRSRARRCRRDHSRRGRCLHL